MKRDKHILLDIMRGERFVCQMRYPTDRCRVVVTDTSVEHVADAGDIERFVREQRKSLRTVRDLRILPSKNLVR